MNIFDKRPLFLIITAFISGFVGFTLSDSRARGILLVSAILLLILSLVFYHKKVCKNLLFIALPLVIIISMAFSYVYFDIYFKLYEQYENEVNIEGTIVSIEEGEYSSTIIVQTSKIQNKTKIGYKIRLYLRNYSLGEELVSGSKISFKATLREFEDFSDMDATAYYFADGICADATDVNEIKNIGRSSIPIAAYAENARKSLSVRAEVLSSERAGTLFSALFLGERDLLGDQIKLDFKRLGITHILALSGLHLSIISLGISRVLTAIKVKKKTRLVIVSIFILAYMILTGLSVSVVRAGIMILISSALFLLGKTKDSVTSLSIAVLMILLVSPYAVYDLALWLSALSTLGIVAMGDIEEYKPSKNTWENIIKTILGSLKASLFATSATLAVTLGTFGATSILSAIATFVFSILAEIIIYLGMIMLLFGRIIPIGFILNYISEAVYWLARFMAKPDWIYLCTEYSIIFVVVSAYTIAFALFLALKLKNTKRAATILAICFVMIIILSLGVNLTNANEDISICAMDKNGDRILLRSDFKVALISSTDHSSTEAYKSYKLLSDRKITYLNVYYITNYSPQLLDDALKITSLIKVDTIYVPSPQNEEEKYILEDLISATKYSSSEIYVYEIEEEIEFNKYTISSLYRSKYGDTYEKNAFRISNENSSLLYLSPGMLLGTDKMLAYHMIPGSSDIIFGCHGYKDHSSITMDVYNESINNIYVGNSKLTIIQSVFEAYKKSGTTIYRDATIEIFN
jgi:competence protein ComEC